MAGEREWERDVTPSQQSLEQVLAGIRELDARAMEETQQRLDRLTKPTGSLGDLEALAVRWSGICQGKPPRHPDKSILLLAGDHGVTAEGVSPFPQQVTVQMVQNILGGGAAVNAVARAVGAKVWVADVGMKTSLPAHERLFPLKVRAGTGNLLVESAMTVKEAVSAVMAGFSAVEELVGKGAGLIALGEMGIGNTTPSACLLTALTGADVEETVGRGTGVDETGLRRKKEVVRQAVARFRQAEEEDTCEPHAQARFLLRLMSQLGGLEIAALAGAMLGGGYYRRPVIVDGFIVSVAALWAQAFCPAVKDFLFLSHLSEEQGHCLAVKCLGRKPYLHFQMRLGEGTGSGMMLSAFEVVSEVLWGMATFQEAGIDNR